MRAEHVQPGKYASPQCNAASEASESRGAVIAYNLPMTTSPQTTRDSTMRGSATRDWTIHALRRALADGSLTPADLAEQALARSNGNPGRNTYLWQDAAWTRAEAARAAAMPRGTGGPFGDGRPALWGLPVTVKDCFDLAGAPTTCGVSFYRDLNGTARRDSWLVERLRALGAVIIGKTHLHPLAYGITGENSEFGDCVQPGNPGALTGGSSSGAAASVLEGSAVAAIGTDTGGSVRAPAALCGLAGYRSSLGRGDWRGGAHLAESFDTMGWLFRDLEDAPFVAAPFAPDATGPAASFTRFGLVADSFLQDCEPAVAAGFHAAVGELEALGLESRTFDPGWWAESREIFAPLQAWEAARVHAAGSPRTGPSSVAWERIEPAIRERLELGARITPAELAALRQRHSDFNARMDGLFAEHQLLLMPATPVARLAAGADHSQTRTRLLRYTMPFSLAGVPCVTIPCAAGGVQLAAPRGSDESLLALAARLGAGRKKVNSAPDT